MSTPAYVDLMFAWAHARLGDPAAAGPLAEDAELRLSTGDATHQWLATAFGHRVRQAVSGQPHSGEWPEDILRSLPALGTGWGAPTGNRYITDRMRLQSSVLEPDMRADPYTGWKRFRTELQARLGALEAATDPDQFAGRFGSLLADTAGPGHADDRLSLLLVAANHGRRAPPDVVEVINREGLQQVDQFLRDPPALPNPEHVIRHLASALCDLAVGRQDDELLGRVTLRLADWVRYGPGATGRPAAAILFDILLSTLYRADRATDAALLLDLVGESGDVLRPGPADLPGRVRLAGFERWLGLRDWGKPVFAEARNLLAGGTTPRLTPDALVRLAESYVQALGRGPISDSGPDMLDLFARLPRVPNGFTTATHFSRFHLTLAEAAILAVALDDFRPARDLHARLGLDETAARRNLLPALRERIRAWAGPDW